VSQCLLQAVVFDFHQTLFQFDDSPAWISKAAERIGRNLSATETVALWSRVDGARRHPDAVRRMRGQDLSRDAHREATNAWLALAGLDQALIDATYAVLCDPGNWLPYPDTEPVVSELARRGIPVGILSNTGWDIRPTFRRWGLEEAITVFVLSCEYGREKPDPELFRLACAELATDPAATLMVGDNPWTDGRALGVGMPVLLISSFFHPRIGRGLALVLDLLTPG
jgi:HAD superfamily hydrolase (TIGR01509 family)